MKLAGYQGQVNPGVVETPNLQVAQTQDMYGDGGKGMAALGNVIGLWSKAIKQRQDEDDQQAAFQAINDYTRQNYNLLYGEENGLMNKTGSNAANIGNAFISGEKEIRDNVISNIKFHNKRNMIALQQTLDRQALGNFQNVGRHEYKQKMVEKTTTMNNAIENWQLIAQKNFNNPEMVANGANYLDMYINSSFPDLGDEQIVALKRDAIGKLYSSAIQASITANDTTAYDSLMKAGAPFLTAAQRENFNKVHTTYVKDDAMRKTVKAAFENGMTRKQAEAYFRGVGVKDGSVGSVGSIAEQAAGAAKYVEEVTGIPANLIYAQWKLESGNFESPLAKQNLNLGGLTQNEFNGAENKQPDGRNYYKKYNSVEEYAKDYIKSFIGLYDFNPADINSPEAFARLLKKYDYYGANEADYAAGIKGGMNAFEGAYGAYKGKNGSTGDTAGNGSPLSEKEFDAYMSYYDHLVAQDKHNKTVTDLKQFQTNKDYIYNTFINRDGGMAPIEEALNWARDSAGSDLALAKKNTEAVKAWYKIYGVNTTSGGKGPKLDNMKLDDLIRGGISQKELRDGLAERGYNATQVNTALKRWQQHFERKGVFAVNKNDILNVAMNGRTSNLTQAEIAKRNGAWKWILAEAAKIEATENKGQPITEHQLLQLAQKARDGKDFGWFSPKLDYAKAALLGYKFNMADADHYNVIYNDEAGDEVSGWLKNEDFADKVNKEFEAAYGK